MSAKCNECGADARIEYDTPLLGEQGSFTIVCDECPCEMHVPAEARSRVRIHALRAIVRDHQAARIDGYIVDATTASLLVKVYEALSPCNRERFGKPDLMRLVDLAWKSVKVA